jgi:chromosome segregation ATPase
MTSGTRLLFRATKYVCQTVVAGLFVLGIALGHALAQDDPGADVDAIKNFAKQIETLKKSLGDLKIKIDDSAKAIEKNTDVETARKKIEELSTLVSNLLAAAADNGEIAKLGEKALGNARERLKHFRGTPEFSQERQDYLIQQWERLAHETEQATKDLDGARKRFADLLLRLQKDDDYLLQLMRVAQGQEALDIIRELIKALNDTSNELNNFIKSISPPKAGS